MNNMMDRHHPFRLVQIKFEKRLGSATNLYGAVALSFVIPSDCLNCQGLGGAPLEVEAEGSALSFPPGRVPHVCAGVAGALHGLNKMGRSPFRCCLSRPAKSKNEKNPSPASRTMRSDLRFRGPLLETRNTTTQTKLSSRPERTRISCRAALETTACAAFSKESRMKFANAININRKSGAA
jgi:hypothetical protein